MLESHAVNCLAVGANKDHSSIVDLSSKVGIFTQKAIAWEYGFNGVFLAYIEDDVTAPALH